MPKRAPRSWLKEPFYVILRVQPRASLYGVFQLAGSAMSYLERTAKSHGLDVKPLPRSANSPTLLAKAHGSTNYDSIFELHVWPAPPQFTE